MPGQRLPARGRVDRLLSALPDDLHRSRVFVAFVDGELCAAAELREAPQRYRWDLIELAAGSPRLDATDDVCEELWTALLEVAIRRAGEAAVKRVFASSVDDGPARAALRASGFEAYSPLILLRGTVPAPPVALPAGMRPQDASDVWSIHQLYHRATPRAVQFAEASTSAVWELPEPQPWHRLGIAKPAVSAYVLETTDGIEGYCRIDALASGAIATLLVADEIECAVPELVVAAAVQAGIRAGAPLALVLPGYRLEHVTAFERAGFVVAEERVALVRHTTAPALVQTRLAPLPADAERVPRGVPSYYRASRARGSRVTCRPNH